MNAIEQRKAALRQYVVFRVKLIELLHLILLNIQLNDASVPENVMGHGVDRFRETLLGSAVIAFMAINDGPQSTNIRGIWKVLYPRHARAIERVWQKRIVPGETIMKAYRDKAGAHGDKINKYFEGKWQIFKHRDVCISALRAFLGLSIALERKQSRELPNLQSDIEAILLDVELANTGTEVFNRRWLREMHLIEGGRYRKTFL